MTVLKNSSFKIQAAPVKDIALIDPELGAIVYNERDGKMYEADSLGWKPVGSQERAQMTFFYDGVEKIDNINTNFWFRLAVGKNLIVDWGDGTIETIPGQGSSVIHLIHTYTEEGGYFIKFGGDYKDITSFNVGGHRNLRFRIDWLVECQLLYYLTLEACGAIGDVSVLANLPIGCEIYLLRLPNVGGDVSTLKDMIDNITIWELPKTSFTRSDAFHVNRNQVQFKENGWSRTEIHNALKALSNLTNQTIAIVEKESRGPESNPYVEQIVNNGNIFSINEPVNLFEEKCGPELFTDPSPISDPAGAESNSLSAFTATGLAPPNIFAVETLRKTKGAYSIKCDCTPNPTNFAEIALTTPITVVAGDVMRVAWDWRHTGSGGYHEGDIKMPLIWGRWSARIFNSYPAQNVFPWDTEFTRIAYYRLAPDTSLEIAFREQFPGVDIGGIYLDNVSVRKVTF